MVWAGWWTSSGDVRRQRTEGLVLREELSGLWAEERGPRKGNGEKVQAQPREGSSCLSAPSPSLALPLCAWSPEPLLRATSGLAPDSPVRPVHWV